MSVTEFDASATREEQRYLVHGFRRELIACLVRFREWLVRDQPPGRVGLLPPGEARGQFVIEASAFQVADGVRLVLMLREAATNVYLWSERFQISLANWVDAQQSIVRRLATALNVYVSAGRMAVVAHRAISDLKGYDLWLQGQATILGLDPDRWHKASEMFLEVGRQMPDFAPARSGLAQIHNLIHIVLPGVRRSQQRTAQALAYAREAALLDPIDSRSQLSLAWSYAMSNQHEQAVIHLRLALELNENDSWTLMSSAMCSAFCGATERALELAEYALRLPLIPSPLQWAYHVAIRFIRGDYSGCVEAARLAGEFELRRAATWPLRCFIWETRVLRPKSYEPFSEFSEPGGSVRNLQATTTLLDGFSTYSRLGTQRTGNVYAMGWLVLALPSRRHSAAHADRVVPDPAGLQLHPLVRVRHIE